MRKVARILVGTLFACVLLIIVLEVGARLLHSKLFSVAYTKDYVRNALGDISFDTLGLSVYSDEYVPHPYLGYTSDPLSLGPFGKRHTSRFGFPGADMELQRSDHERIVAITGGSVALNLYSSSAALLARELTALHQFAGYDIRITCLALPGFKQPQQLMTLNYFLAQNAQFDLVINLDGLNDIAQPLMYNRPRGIALIYPGNWSSLAGAAPSTATLLLLADIRQLQQRRRHSRDALSVSLFRNSAFVFSVWQGLDRRLERETYALRERWNALAIERPKTPLEAGPSFGLEPLDRDEALRQAAGLWSTCSLQMAYLCEANGIPYFHFLQPNQYVPDSKVLTEKERKIAVQDGLYKNIVPEGYPLLIQEGRRLSEQGVNFNDMTQVFKDASGSIYVDNCCHVNDDGNAIMAIHIAQTIARKLNIP